VIINTVTISTDGKYTTSTSLIIIPEKKYFLKKKKKKKKKFYLFYQINLENFNYRNLIKKKSSHSLQGNIFIFFF
jgi:hypothetical protein